MIEFVLDNYNLYERNLQRYFEKNVFNYSKLFIFEWISVLFTKINKFIFHDIYINYIEFPITTKCSLRCKECANLIQYYDEGRFLDCKEIINDVYKLCQTVKGIEMVRLLGGEPLLHPKLKEILIGILKNNNIKNVQIVTNGTLLIDKDMLVILKDKRVSIDISNYGKVSRNYNNLIKLLRKNKINFVTNKNLEWTPQGDCSYRNRSYKELKNILKVCRSDCISVLDGIIHICPRSSNGHDLKIFEPDESDYVNLRDCKTRKELKQKLFYLLNKKSIVACNYCDYYMRDKFKTCIAGEQISKEEALERYNTMICVERKL